MSRLLLFIALVLSVVVASPQSLPQCSLRADYPKPSVYPISWELKFAHGKPQRIVVQSPGDTVARAYWYFTYTITNDTDQEQSFLPVFEMLSEEGKVIRSDTNVSVTVFNAIKAREKKDYLEPFTKIAGELRLGEDQARDGVVIFPEPTTRMGRFSIFVAGLSGEAVALKDDKGEVVKDKDGNPTIFRKTLRLNFHIRGDEVYPGEDDVNENPEEWVMR